MKTIKVIIEEPSHPVINFQNTRKKGRPKNITKKIKIGGFELGRLPHDLYLELVNLKSDGIDHFVRKYQPLLPEQVKGSNFSTNNDIQKFQKELRSIYGGIKVFNKFHRNSLAHTLLLLRRKTNNLDLLVNKYLKYCHLDLELAPIIQEQLSPDQLSKHQKQIQDFDKESSGFLRDDVLNHPKRGFNISLLKIKCDNLYSWCVLNLVNDKLVKKELVLKCSNCNRLFKAGRKDQLYCGFLDCKKETARKRRNKSYAKKVSRKKVT